MEKLELPIDDDSTGHHLDTFKARLENGEGATPGQQFVHLRAPERLCLKLYRLLIRDSHTLPVTTIIDWNIQLSNVSAHP